LGQQEAAAQHRRAFQQFSSAARFISGRASLLRVFGEANDSGGE
jgi:hypothetical protein